MLAFHNDPAIKAEKLAQVMAHQAADEIIKGQYWENGKGCAVGCTVHSDTHLAYETEMGIPIMLARLEDGIFEGMSNDKAKLFPARFISAIPVGADLSFVAWKFLHWLIVDTVERHGRAETKAGTIAAIEVLRKKSIGEYVAHSDVIKAREEAYQARKMASAAAASAYAAAASAYAADASAADASAAASAAYAAAAYAAYDARNKAFDRQAEKLLELLADAP